MERNKYKFQKPPVAPTIDGPKLVNIGIEYDFNFMSSDPEGDVVRYYVEWGDGSYEGWKDYYDSGEVITLSHKWYVKNCFNIIRCKTQDIDGGVSNWRRAWVSIIKIKDRLPFFMFLEQFSLLQTFLQRLGL